MTPRRRRFWFLFVFPPRRRWPIRRAPRPAATVTFRSGSTAVATGTGNSSPSKPAGTGSTDLMVAYIAQAASATPPTAPNGSWTLLTSQTSGSFGVWCYTAIGSASVVGGWTGTGAMSGYIVSAQGTGTLAAVGAAQANGSSTSCQAPSVTGPGSGLLVCGFVFDVGEISLTQDGALTTPTGGSSPSPSPATLIGYLNGAAATTGTHTATTASTAAVNIGISVLVTDSSNVDNVTNSPQGQNISKGPHTPRTDDTPILPNDSRSAGAAILFRMANAPVAPASPVVPPLVAAGLASLVLAEDTATPYGGGLARILGGNPGLQVTPPPPPGFRALPSPLHAATGDVLTPQVPGYARVLAGPLLGGRTPPTLRVVAVAQAAEGLDHLYQPPAFRPFAVLTPPAQPAAPARLAPGPPEDVVSADLAAGGRSTVSRAIVSVTPVPTRPMLALPEDPLTASGVVPQGQVWDGAPGANVTPPTHRPPLRPTYAELPPADGQGALAWITPVHLRPAPVQQPLVVPALDTAGLEPASGRQPAVLPQAGFWSPAVLTASGARPAEEWAFLLPAPPFGTAGPPTPSLVGPRPILAPPAEDLSPFFGRLPDPVLRPGQANAPGTPPVPRSVVPAAQGGLPPYDDAGRILGPSSPIGGATPPSLRPVLLAPAEDVLSQALPPQRVAITLGPLQAPGPRPTLFVPAEDVLSPLRGLDALVAGPWGQPRPPVAGLRPVLVAGGEDFLSPALPPQGRSPAAPVIPFGRPPAALLTVIPAAAPDADALALAYLAPAPAWLWTIGPWDLAPPLIVSQVAATGLTAVLENLALTAGEDKQFLFTVYQADGATPQPVTGWALQFLLFAPEDPDTFWLTKTTAAGQVTIQSGPLGQVLVQLVAADTINWHAPVQLAFRLERTDSGSNDVVAYGLLTVLPR